MKILVGDKFEASGLAGLRETGSEVLFEPDLKDDALGARLAETGADVLIVRSTKVTASILEAAKGLSLVVRAGAGVNTIDLKTASLRGVFVANCPGKNSIAVAELALGLILALDRRIPENVRQLRAGQWNKKEFSKAKGLFGQALGIAGMGSIGREVARRARSFGLRTLAWSRSLTAEKAEELGVERVGSVLELAERSDIVTVHLAAAPETKGIFGAEFFSKMRKGAMFVNTARADLVDAAALLQAIDSRKIRVALDVFPNEPSASEGPIDDSLARHENVLGTHHIGASTDQAQEAIAAETVRIVREYIETGKVENVVNLSRRPPATHLLVLRHRDRVGVLAHVLGALKADGISVQGMENIIFEGAQAACARIELDKEPGGDTLQAIRRGNEDIFSLTVTPLR
ncbi:MAG: NAD(P)-dependent oxidoreductase [Thermoanaerobaculia bacterium]